ncbi:MAG: membrane protein insertion efficiency factor YidD [Rickettsiales bacterium]|jgi:putative membrane protein insertion efficiency factor|nr:membrane protein insertion efficiency factor YidD [Rickettsiales bacterium]
MSAHSTANTSKANIASRAVRLSAIRLIGLYQIMISPLFGGRATCRFVPTCSEYARQAILKYGMLRGGMMSVRRISRCRPGGGFGYDPVP